MNQADPTARRLALAALAVALVSIVLSVAAFIRAGERQAELERIHHALDRIGTSNAVGSGRPLTLDPGD